MNLRTLAAFLIGDREAIKTLADERGAIWLGMLLVLSAGLAREYDAEYLLAEPWHLLIPFAGSLMASFLLHSLLNVVGRWEVKISFLEGYRRFLGLFWLTAPLAWLYAIPYERFLGDLGAVQANLWTLFFVALWRVVLMIRVVSVIYGAPLRQAVFPVLLFSDTLALIGVQAVPFPLIAVMGGVRLEPGEVALRSAAGAVLCWGAASWGVWFLGTAWVATQARRTLWLPHFADDDRPPARGGGVPVALAGAVIAGLGAAMTHTQREQALRYEAERALDDRGLPGFLQVVTGHEEGEFPPHWSGLRGWRTRAQHPDELAEVTRSLEALGSRQFWAREYCVTRVRPQIQSALREVLFADRPPRGEVDVEARDREVAFFAALAALPEGHELIESYRDELRKLLWDLRRTRGSQPYEAPIQALIGAREATASEGRAR